MSNPVAVRRPTPTLWNVEESAFTVTVRVSPEWINAPSAGEAI